MDINYYQLSFQREVQWEQRHIISLRHLWTNKDHLFLRQQWASIERTHFRFKVLLRTQHMVERMSTRSSFIQATNFWQGNCKTNIYSKQLVKRQRHFLKTTSSEYIRADGISSKTVTITCTREKKHHSLKSISCIQSKLVSAQRSSLLKKTRFPRENRFFTCHYSLEA